MKRPIFVRPLSDAEREALEAGLRSSDAFVLRRCQILLASSRGENAYQIARSLGCNPQTARNAIHTFNERGLPEALQRGASARRFSEALQRGSKRLVRRCVAPCLGQRLLAHLQRGQRVDHLPQPTGQKEWRRGKDHKLLVAQKEPVAQSDRAEVDTRQTEGDGSRRPARRPRTGELADRVCAAFDCPHYEHLSVTENVT